MSIKITGFHTCHLQGSYQQIHDSVPFCSDKKKEQWLGQGYYFWTDACFFADTWGRMSAKYPSGYVITKFEIEIPVEEFLDLVGNVLDQLTFEKQIRKYLERLHKELDKKTAMATPISKVLEHLREEAKEQKMKDEEFFSYSAIKAADIPINSFSYPYLENKAEKLIIPIRQQLFFAEGYESWIKGKAFYKIYRRVNSQYQIQQIPVVRETK